MVSDNKRKITLVGYGGHAIVVADTALALGVPLKYYVNKSEVHHNPFKLSYIGDEWSDDFDKWSECSFLLGIGCNTARMKVADLIKSVVTSIFLPGYSFCNCKEYCTYPTRDENLAHVNKLADHLSYHSRYI